MDLVVYLWPNIACRSLRVITQDASNEQGTLCAVRRHRSSSWVPWSDRRCAHGSTAARRVLLVSFSLERSSAPCRVTCSGVPAASNVDAGRGFHAVVPSLTASAPLLPRVSITTTSTQRTHTPLGSQCRVALGGRSEWTVDILFSQSDCSCIAYDAYVSSQEEDCSMCGRVKMT